MKSSTAGLIAVFCGLLCAGGLCGQNTVSPPPSSASRLLEVTQKQNALRSTPGQNTVRVPKAFQDFRVPPTGPLWFLASGEGRGLLEATHHPLAQYLSKAFHGNADAPIAPAPASLSQFEAVKSMGRVASGAAGTVPCTGSAGARFNLEPRANAVPQSQEMADFVPSGVAPGDDLIVQAADDFRGNLASDPNWDQSVSGYYVHRSSTPDCSVQFEGGLPSFQFQGNTVMGIGDTVVAADPMRNAIFIADLRFGNAAGSARTGPTCRPRPRPAGRSLRRCLCSVTMPRTSSVASRASWWMSARPGRERERATFTWRSGLPPPRRAASSSRPAPTRSLAAPEQRLAAAT